MKDMKKMIGVLLIVLWVLDVLTLKKSSQADDFTKQDVERYTKEFMTVVKEGDRLFHSSTLGKNKVSCDQCHPNGASTHPETYPKFQTQLAKVAQLRDMVNWCIINPLEGKELAHDDPKLKALEAYILAQRRGTALDAGKH